MDTLRVEVGVALTAMEFGGLQAEVFVRTPHFQRTIRDQVFPPGAVRSSNVEDLVMQLSQAVWDQLSIGPGVQLVLHD